MPWNTRCHNLSLPDNICRWEPLHRAFACCFIAAKRVTDVTGSQRRHCTGACAKPGIHRPLWKSNYDVTSPAATLFQYLGLWYVIRLPLGCDGDASNVDQVEKLEINWLARRFQATIGHLWIRLVYGRRWGYVNLLEWRHQSQPGQWVPRRRPVSGGASVCCCVWCQPQQHDCTGSAKKCVRNVTCWWLFFRNFV